MAIVFACPSCGARLEMAEEAAGTVAKCPECNAETTVPERSSPVPVAARDEAWDDDSRPPKKKRTWLIPVLICVGLGMFLCVPATCIGLLVPAVQRVREAAARTATMNNLSQCAKAVHLAHDNYKKFPPYYGPYPADGAPASFHSHLVMFMDSRMNAKPKPDPQEQLAYFASPMDPTLTDSGAGAANYPVNLRLFYTDGGLGVLGTGDKLIYPEIPKSFMKDGTSNTLLFATKYHHCGKNGGSFWADTNALDSPTAATFGKSMALWQVAPTQAGCDPMAGTAVSFTVSSIQLAMCDGSTRNQAAGISQATWQAVHTPNAGDAPGGDWDN
jgi:hypothetical protein